MKRLETLMREADRFLARNRYRHAESNTVDKLDIARALDQIARAEETLRRAFPEPASSFTAGTRVEVLGTGERGVVLKHTVYGWVHVKIDGLVRRFLPDELGARS